MSLLDQETSLASAYKVSCYSQLLISIQKYKTPRARTTDEFTGRRNRFRGCWQRWNCERMVDSGSAMQVYICILPPPSEGLHSSATTAPR